MATYNVHRCVGWDGLYSRERILEVLQELQADLIALQEVEREETLQWFAESLGMTAIADLGVQHAATYGNGVLTTCTLDEIRLVDLSVLGYEPRGAIDVDVSCEGERVQVIATHLGLRPGERRWQVNELLKRFGTRHCILMGDINEWLLWGRPLRRINRIFGHSPPLRSFPSPFPVFALDRIWIRPPGSVIDIRIHTTARSRVASDHLPVRAVMEW
ncbi:MAG: endonuclease/exonuclease/phosphatase family protein [Nitrospira sp.]|nr:endonuclease/exonuclease/phosphatase family protein [Nitrospira sp.]